MKYLFTFIFAASTLFCSAQQFWYISFESGEVVYPFHFYRDTLSDTNNIWQIGQPQKNFFASAHSGIRAAITDSVNSYPANDTSILYLKLPVWAEWSVGYPWYGILFRLEFKYKLDIDPGDYGLFQISLDSGQSWVDFQDDSVFNFTASHPLDSSTSNWETMQFYNWNLQTNLGLNDSFYFRFIFISDSVQSYKDGWIIDDFEIQYFFTDVKNIKDDSSLSLYPNPSSGHIKLTSKKGTLNGTIQVTNLSGQTVYQTNHIPSTGDLHLPLPDGLYILRYSDDKTTTTQKLIIQH